jgi:uncharacterized protein (TIGR01777 family)
VQWDPVAGTIDAARLEGFDAVVHLAGESIAGGRWTAKRKSAIGDSRVGGTRLLAGALARAKARPRVLVTASAVGIYGCRGDAILTEDSAPGEGFLAEVCKEWQAANAAAIDAGIRVAMPRFGLVLSKDGGALPKIVKPFQLGLGGRLGSGTQYLSWIALDDAVLAIAHALSTESLAGPFNATAPAPVTNLLFTRALAEVLHRPALLPVPATALRLLLGEMADALLLCSARVMPRRLRESGYTFQFDSLDGALQHALGKTGKDKSRTFFT